MIEFASEEVRQEFHLLSPQTQKEYSDLAYSFLPSGQIITIVSIEKWGEKDSQLEVSIRIDKKFDVVSVKGDVP